MARKKGIILPIVFFVIQPFLGFLISLKSFASRRGGIIFVLFSTLWGYCQSFTYTPTDGYRLAANFCTFPITGFGQIVDMIRDGKVIDIFLPLANWLTHQVSDNPKVYFALLGFVFGLLCYKTLAGLMRESGGERNRTQGCILLMMFVTSSLANLTMPRFWTASWLAAYVFLKISRGENRAALLAILLPFVHFSYWPIAAVLIVTALFKTYFVRFQNILFAAVCVMFLISFVMPVTVFQRFIPSELVDSNSKFSSKMVYISGDEEDAPVGVELSAYREANTIVTKTFQILMKAGSFIALIALYLQRRRFAGDKLLRETFTSVLILALAVYFMSIIPETGWRYIWLLWLGLYIMLYRYCGEFRQRQAINWLLPMLVMNIYNIAFMFYVTWRTVDLILFYGPLPLVVSSGFGFGPVQFV